MISSQSQGNVLTVVIVTLTVAIIGGLGYVFWQNFKPNDTTPVVVQTLESKATPVRKNSRSAYALADAVGDMTKTLADGVCKGNGSQIKEGDFITVNDSDQFVYQSGKSLINKDLTHAYVQYGCGSQGVVAFMAREERESVWLLVHETARMYAHCDGIRGYNFPPSIVSKCYDTEDAAEPVNWKNE